MNTKAYPCRRNYDVRPPGKRWYRVLGRRAVLYAFTRKGGIFPDLLEVKYVSPMPLTNLKDEYIVFICAEGLPDGTMGTRKGMEVI